MSADLAALSPPTAHAGCYPGFVARFVRSGTVFVLALTFVGLAAAASLVLTASLQSSLTLFLIGFVLLFVLSGLGNGSTYKMIPAIFKATRETYEETRRMSGALIVELMSALSFRITSAGTLLGAATLNHAVAT